MLTRAEALAELSTLQPVLGITGTHGKSTATSMLVHVLHAAHRDDSRLLGAPVLGVGPNGHWGNGALVLEVDESYGTFALLSPHALGVLNVEPDHLDHYGTLDNLELAFVSLIERTTGVVVLWVDDAGVARIRDRLERDVVTVSEQDDASWNVRDIEVSQRGSSFVLANRDEQHELTLHVTGRHNVLNAAVVAVLALESGIAIEAVRSGLALFEGVPRRFDFRGSWRGVDVYEDYAHLPAEITATLEAARAAGYQRIVAVFQPHRFSRTHAVGTGFAPAFDLADEVIVTAIYASGEENVYGVSGADVADAIQSHRGYEVRYAATKGEVLDALALADGDALFFIGAGDVGQWADDVVTA
jgi:UDP-N-acetylmuramate--alanine ligase